MKKKILFLYCISLGCAVSPMGDGQPTKRVRSQSVETLSAEESALLLHIEADLAKRDQTEAVEVLSSELSALLLQAEGNSAKRTRAQSVETLSLDESAFLLQAEADLAKRTQPKTPEAVDGLGSEESALLLYIEADLAKRARSQSVETLSPEESAFLLHAEEDLAKKDRPKTPEAIEILSSELSALLLQAEENSAPPQAQKEILDFPRVSNARLRPDQLTAKEAIENFINNPMLGDWKALLETYAESLKNLPISVKANLLRCALSKYDATRSTENAPLTAVTHAIAQRLLHDHNPFPQHFFTKSKDSINPIDALRFLIDDAQHRVRGACYCINNKSIIASLMHCIKRGVSVQLIIDQGQDPHYTNIAGLLKAGARVWVHEGRGMAHMHEKFMLFKRNVFGKFLVAQGSMNWTNNAARSAEDLTIHESKDSYTAFRNRFKELTSTCNEMTIKDSYSKV